MARERWDIDGYEITNGYLRDLEVREGLYATAGPVGTNPVVPYRSGELWRPKVSGASGFVLNLWIGAGSRSELDAYYDELVRLCMRLARPRTITRTMADGSQRICLAEVASGLTPVPIGSTGMRLAIEFRVPSGVWYSAATASTFTGTPGILTVPRVITLTGELAKSTAPMDRLIYTITGPIANARLDDLTNGSGGDTLTYSATLGFSESIIIDAGEWTVTGAGGHVPNQAALAFSGGRYLTVQPAAPGSSPRVQLSGASTGSTTNLSVSGIASYLA
jgi:hypothetical protein